MITLEKIQELRANKREIDQEIGGGYAALRAKMETELFNCADDLLNIAELARIPLKEVSEMIRKLEAGMKVLNQALGEATDREEKRTEECINLRAKVKELENKIQGMHEDAAGASI